MQTLIELAKKLGIPTEGITEHSEQCLTFEGRVRQAQEWAKLINESEGEGDCPKCKGRGYFATVRLIGGLIYEGERQCECAAKDSVMYHLKKSGLCKVDKYTFDSFSDALKWQRAMKSKAEKFTKEKGKWFFIGGQSGGGKSHICTAMAIRLIEEGKALRYMLWEKEWARIRAFANDERRDAELRPWKDVEILYIDDLFKHKKGEYPTGAEVMLCYELLNHRLLNNLTTIISSEFFIGEIMELDEAVGGRIIEKTGKEYALTIPRGIEQNMRVQMAK